MNAMVTLFSASAILGTDVLTAEHFSLGTLRDLIYDTSSSQLAYYIIEAGAYLGLEDRLYAVHQRHFYLHPEEEVLIFHSKLREVQADPPPDLPEYYENMSVASAQAFALLLDQFTATPSHRTDCEGI